MRRSITSNYTDTGALPFREAARLTLRELKQQRKDIDVLLSHALSSYGEDEGRWIVRSISGADVSHITDDGTVVIIEEEAGQ